MSDWPTALCVGEGGWVPRLNLQHHPTTVPPPTTHTAQCSFAFCSKQTSLLCMHRDEVSILLSWQSVLLPHTLHRLPTSADLAYCGATKSWRVMRHRLLQGTQTHSAQMPVVPIWAISVVTPHSHKASSSPMMNDKLHIHTCTHPTVICHTTVEPPLQRRTRRTAANRTAISKSSLHSLHRATTAKHSTPWRRVSLCAERGPGLVAPPLHSFKVVLSLLLFSR